MRNILFIAFFCAYTNFVYAIERDDINEPYQSVVTQTNIDYSTAYKEKSIPTLIMDTLINIKSSIFGEKIKSNQTIKKNGNTSVLVEEIQLPPQSIQLQLQKELISLNGKYVISLDEQEIIDFAISSSRENLSYNQVIKWKNTSMTMIDLTFWVVQHNYKEALKTILALGVIDVNTIKPETLLHSAVLTQDIETVNIILANIDNVTLNEVDSKFKENALFKAVTYGPSRNTDIMSSLMEKRINPNIRNIQSVPLISKIVSDPEIKDRIYDDLISYCLKNGVTLKDTDDRLNTPLHFAASYNPIALKRLIPLYKKEWRNEKDNSDYLNIQNMYGNTPAMEAVKNLNSESLTILINEGADLSIKNKTSQSILDIAIKTVPIEFTEKDRQLKKEIIYKQLKNKGF